jgi:hypothetical protein
MEGRDISRAETSGSVTTELTVLYACDTWLLL